MSWIKDHPQGCVIQIKVSAGSKVSELSGFHEGRLKLRLHALAIEGKANKELFTFWQKQLGISLKNLTLLSGEFTPYKTLLIEEVSKEKIKALVSQSLKISPEDLYTF